MSKHTERSGSLVEILEREQERARRRAARFHRRVVAAARTFAIRVRESLPEEIKKVYSKRWGYKTASLFYTFSHGELLHKHLHVVERELRYNIPDFDRLFDSVVISTDDNGAWSARHLKLRFRDDSRPTRKVDMEPVRAAYIAQGPGDSITNSASRDEPSRCIIS